MEDFANPEHGDLREMRVQAGVSCEDIVRCINGMPLQDRDGRRRIVTLSQIMDADEDPEAAPVWLRRAWMQTCGYDAPAVGLKPTPRYDPLAKMRRKMVERLSNMPDDGFGDETRRLGFDRAGLAEKLSSCLRKPVLGISGASIPARAIWPIRSPALTSFRRPTRLKPRP